MRGIPGSGKSTTARKIAGDEGVICSADNYFLDDLGNYNFRPNLLSRAHDSCYYQFMVAMGEGMDTIIIDNTNTRHKEYSRYVNAAKERGYNVKIVYPDSPWSKEIMSNMKMGEFRMEDAKKFEYMGTHDVPLETIMTMMKRFEF